MRKERVQAVVAEMLAMELTEDGDESRETIDDTTTSRTAWWRLAMRWRASMRCRSSRGGCLRWRRLRLVPSAGRREIITRRGHHQSLAGVQGELPAFDDEPDSRQ